MWFNCKWVWWDSNQLDRNEVDVSNIAGNSTAFNNEKKTIVAYRRPRNVKCETIQLRKWMA